MMDTLLEILESLRPDLDFTQDQQLIDDGILDSFDIVTLVGELSVAFDVEITVEHLQPENFNTPKAMLALIASLQE